ncbi:DUF305 domain-containing protein [Mycolicibacterium pulveris]|uniref:DUF305 domain-containing protein n=1 Tax=Mycolicibacterium pulveris TaxID=36813 RepID=A0A7I7UHG2_MYCPV|nr:DUF305 domain-containing protein [Mycolicibacterium pulveris]MCV6979606.1 DUF305 domain-containing protein [Mycolicibacterium pulveris]BBY80948.1 hypothetical protein MPUL_21060 [Mycolicibacterium pulveris]
MTSFATRIVAAFVALATALLVSSCSQSESSEGHPDHQAPDTPAITGQPAGYNADDVAFATNMIPHHEQAVEMSALVPERSTNPEVIALAEQISAAQQPEINALRVFLVQWNENPDTATGDGHAHHGDMQGMVDEATMAKLSELTGEEFDTLWLESMISHHEGAVEMAKAEIANGENVDAKRMAQTIIDTQQAEIDQMQQMLRGPNG